MSETTRDPDRGGLQAVQGGEALPAERGPESRLAHPGHLSRRRLLRVPGGDGDRAGVPAAGGDHAARFDQHDSADRAHARGEPVQERTATDGGPDCGHRGADGPQERLHGLLLLVAGAGGREVEGGPEPADDAPVRDERPAHAHGEITGHHDPEPELRADRVRPIHARDAEHDGERVGGDRHRDPAVPVAAEGDAVRRHRARRWRVGPLFRHPQPLHGDRQGEPRDLPHPQHRAAAVDWRHQGVESARARELLSRPVRRRSSIDPSSARGTTTSSRRCRASPWRR